ncbi:hypothetical protein GF345_01805 [Candidatus Woesearchaeota archaeon]|nr:hypothetical protein [Candidatus Woesearchaeota archaeon]
MVHVKRVVNMPAKNPKKKASKKSGKSSKLAGSTKSSSASCSSSGQLRIVSKKGSCRSGSAKKSSKTKLRKSRHINEAVPIEYAFHLNGGKVLTNLKELAEALESMDEGTFSHHANEGKNDFSRWVMDVINEKNLSVNLCGKGREDARKEVLRFIRLRS